MFGGPSIADLRDKSQHFALSLITAVVTATRAALLVGKFLDKVVAEKLTRPIEHADGLLLGMNDRRVAILDFLSLANRGLGRKRVEGLGLLPDLESVLRDVR